jgi:hypothetical protein
MSNISLFQPGVLDAIISYARVLVSSGLLPQAINTPEKATAIITQGLELGISPWAALNGINVIQGKPTISPALMLALINQSGHMVDLVIQGDATRCSVTMQRAGRTAHTETFTLEDAARMGLAQKSNWKQQPGVMLKWRAVSACARVVFPDVISGLYTHEEIAPDATVDEMGQLLALPELAEDRPAALPQPQSAATVAGELRDVVITKIITEEAATGRRYRLITREPLPGPAFAWERKLFREGGWIAENDWGVVGEYTPVIPIPAVVRALVSEKGAPYWELFRVAQYDFITNSAK